MHHLIVNDDLFLFFSLEANNSAFLIMISDRIGHSEIITRYDFSPQADALIKLESRDSSGFIYNVFSSDESGESSVQSKFFKVSIVDGKVAAPLEIPYVRNMKKESDWTGYCDGQACNAELTSPDNEWHVASGLYDTVFLFPQNRPDLGVNIFVPDIEAKDKDWTYLRNYAWGNKNSFFFDNEGGLACIWKVDIDSKTTARILPVEGLKEPYYIRYHNEDYVVSRYFPLEDDDTELSGFYIAKEAD